MSELTPEEEQRLIAEWWSKPAGAVVIWNPQAAARFRAGLELYWGQEASSRVPGRKHGPRYTFDLRHLEPRKTQKEAQDLVRQVGIESRHGMAHPADIVTWAPLGLGEREP